ncbi:MAG TPA: hypothetical protein VLH15_02960, partial [Dehalococcoidales bacterium]|nr:hypothetical protein [Dehalococcoidales bacterium]
MGSVRELEEQKAEARKQLMQALFGYLGQMGVAAELRPEQATNWLGKAVSESVIHLKEQNLNRIRLVGMESGGCGVPGDIL